MTPGYYLLLAARLASAALESAAITFRLIAASLERKHL